MDDERVEVCACVLAAGESRRMGQPKLLKPFAGSTLLERAVGAARGSGCDRTVVVTGAYHEAMAPLLARWGVDFVRNRSWARGQASSVRCAVGYA